MSVETRGQPPIEPIGCAVLTVSDTRTLDTDTSGAAIVASLVSAGHQVLDRQLVRDEPREVAALVDAWITRPDVRLIVTTGGTGISPRDSTFEAVRRLIEKDLPGFGELFRSLSFTEIGSAAMLTRAAAGVSGHTAIFVLPGAEHAVRLALTRLILPELGHLARELAR